MTMTAGPAPARDLTPTDLRTTARTTGLLYLGFFVVGILGTYVVRGQLFSADDPAQTLSDLSSRSGLARVGIALELTIVLAQALTAVGFYRLFRGVDGVAAGTLAAFGIVNAVAILGSAAALATALDVAGDPALAAAGGQAATVQLMYVVSGHLWGVAAIFFGLWLIPMGRLATRSAWFPRLLGPLLVVAGACYVASCFATYLFSGASSVAQVLTLPSIVGEIWIMAYLVVVGVRAHVRPSAPA